MYVCICKGITDRQIRSAVADGAGNLKQLTRELGVASQCGKCACLAKDVIREAKTQSSCYSSELFYAAG